MKLSEIIQHLFVTLGRYCFINSSFPEIKKFTFTDDRKSAYIMEGRLLIHQFRNYEEYTISIPITACMKSFEDLAQEVLHQLVHFYIYLYYPEDYRDNVNRRYHYYIFRKIGTKAGLIMHNKIKTNVGYDILGIQDGVKDLLKIHFVEESLALEEAVANQIAIFDRKIKIREENKEKASMVEFICPVCKQIARADAKANLICGTCKVNLEKK